MIAQTHNKAKIILIEHQPSKSKLFESGWIAQANSRMFHQTSKITASFVDSTG